MFIGLIVLFFLGICFGSFVNALVWRVQEQSKPKLKTPSSKLPTTNYQLPNNLSIVSGHSMCPNCRHPLKIADLVPLLSWVFLNRRCRYCHKPISAQYPIVEASGGLIFGLSYIAWPNLHQPGQLWLLGTWLLCSVGLLALAVYDIKWQLLPNRILYPTFVVALAGRLAYILAYSTAKTHELAYLLLSIAVASGIFWIIYQLSKAKWIGFGDVRLGLVTGTLLASPSKALLMIFLSSLIGTLAVMPSLLASKRTVSSKVPYGPYLIVSTVICVLYGERLLNWYTANLGY